MIVIVKSAPDTVDGQRGVNLARDMAADLVFLQNGVYFAREERLDNFSGRIYVLDEDLRLRGLRVEEVEKNIEKVDYDTLVGLMTQSGKVVGMF